MLKLVLDRTIVSTCVERCYYLPYDWHFLRAHVSMWSDTSHMPPTHPLSLLSSNYQTYFQSSSEAFWMGNLKHRMINGNAYEPPPSSSSDDDDSSSENDGEDEEGGGDEEEGEDDDGSATEDE